MATPYENGLRVAQRFAFGSQVHHPHLATFFELIGQQIPQFKALAKEQRENAEREFEKKLLIDKLIVDWTKKYPIYQMPQINSMANAMANVTTEYVKENAKSLVARAFEIMKSYEEQTNTLLDEINKSTSDAPESMNQFISQIKNAVENEIKDIEKQKEYFVNFDFEKLKKGAENMNPRQFEHGYDDREREHEMRRRHRAEYEEMARRHYAEREREFGDQDRDDDREHEMRRRRHYGYVPFAPYADRESDDHEYDARRHYRRFY